MREERPATRQDFFSLEFSEDGSRVPAQREPCCAASRDNLGCLVTTSVDEFEPNGYELHTVSSNYWEWYSKCTHSTSTCVMPRKPRRRIFRCVRCEDDHGELPHTFEHSDPQRQSQRKVSSLMGSIHMHRVRAPQRKGE